MSGGEASNRKRPRAPEQPPTEAGNSRFHSGESVTFLGDNRLALSAYAATPWLFPGTVLEWSARWAVVRDKYPKARVHLLVLPRPLAGGPLQACGSLARSPSALNTSHLADLLEMREVAARAAEVELRGGEGGGGGGDAAAAEASLAAAAAPTPLPPGIWLGFHAVPSLEPLHLHVISRDLSGVKSRVH